MLNFRGKKAATPMVIFILVVLVLSIVAYSLFIFKVNDNKISLEISDANAINVLKLRKNSFEFFSEKFLEEVFIESYVEILEQGSFEVDNVDFETIVLLNNINSKINSMAVKSQDEDVSRFRNLIDAGKYDLDFNGEEVNLVFNDVTLVYPLLDRGASFVYKPIIDLKINLEKKKLASFKEVLEVKDLCEENKTFECYSQLQGFNAVVDEESGIVKFESEKDFLIEGSFQKIKFEIK